MVLARWVILTKGNLIRRSWQGSKKCCFFNQDETIQYLFFDCHCAKFLSRIIYITFGLSPPNNTHHIFDSWLHADNPIQAHENQVSKRHYYYCLIRRRFICRQLYSGPHTGQDFGLFLFVGRAELWRL